MGLPVPDAIDTILRVLPTSQAMRPITNGLVGRELFGDVWLSYVVVALWAVVEFGALAWRLARREL